MSSQHAEIVQRSTERVIGGDHFPEIPLLSQVEILVEREGGLYECYVPVELIDHEEVPVKEEWAASLARQMRQKASDGEGTGQQTPIQLGWIEGESKFRIVDGFHRDAALMLNGEEVIYATVKRTTWNKLYDDRIFTAKDHAHVRFSRVVKWIKEVWEHSGLSDQLTVEKAILLYRFDTDGSKSGLAPETVEKAKSWVANKESQWDTAAMTIHSYLQTADSVDPLLVNATRDKKSGHELTAPTQQIIKVFSDTLPNEFALQNLVWEQAEKHNLKGPQVKAVCMLVRDRDEGDAQRILANTDVENIAPAYAETKGRQLRRASDPRYKGAAALEAARVEIERVNERVQISLDRNEPVDPQMIKNLNETVRQAKALQTQLGVLATKLTALREQGRSAHKVVPQAEEDLRAPQTALALRQSVERAYVRLEADKASNAHREPKDRKTLKSEYRAMELPDFQILSKEDWAYLDPQHRLALCLTNPGLQKEVSTSPVGFLLRALAMSALPHEIEEMQTAAQKSDVLKRLSTMLTTCAPRAVGAIIERDEKASRVVVTPNGMSYLKEVVKNTLLAVDDSRQ